MLTSGEVLLHDNERPLTCTAARTRTLLEPFSWDLFDHPPYILTLAPSDYHFFTYLKNCLGSQRFFNNKNLIKAYKNVFPEKKNASVPTMNTLRSS
jgi:hypothetical protein